MAKAKSKAKSKVKSVTKAKHSAKKKADNARIRAVREDVREIGAIPPVKDPKRRARCKGSLQAFCETYYPAKFYLKWSPDHLVAIDRLERCVRFGGLFALAMPRGSGKSQLCRRAVEWAILYGYRRFVILVGATQTDAQIAVEDVKSSFETNDLLLQDFPEACYPVRKLEGIVQRARNQLCDGKTTKLVWKANEIRLARIPKSLSSGATIRIVGITGSIRGASTPASNGGTARPDLAICDDPQGRESAGSPMQVADRERIIRGDILGLAGPTKSIACVMPLTCIYPDDLASRFLDTQRAPQWQGIKTKMVTSFPNNTDLWETYFRIREDSLQAGGDGSPARDFYIRNQIDMDQGAVVSWPERFDVLNSHSAIEEAMKRRHDDPEEFMAEFQNEPIPETGPLEPTKQLVPTDVSEKLNRVDRATVPWNCTRITGFIDPGVNVIWYGLIAWDERFNGGVIEYNCHPAQPKPYFLASEARPNLADRYPGMTEAQRVYAGLRDIIANVILREYRRQNSGEVIRPERVLIDSGWLPDTIQQFVRESHVSPILFASKGYATGSNAKTIDEWTTRPGERSGRGWRLSSLTAGRGRVVTYDPDYWKTFLADRFLTPPGGTGCLSIFGDNPREHQLFADHCCAEFAVRTTARGRVYDKWYDRPDRRDNHLWDVAVGCAVAASVQGVVWSPSDTPPPKPRILSMNEEREAAMAAQAARVQGKVTKL